MSEKNYDLICRSVTMSILLCRNQEIPEYHNGRMSDTIWKAGKVLYDNIVIIHYKNCINKNVFLCHL